jgi:hypothetical protein
MPKLRFVRANRNSRADLTSQAVYQTWVWECGLESRRGHECLSLVGVVCCHEKKSLWRADHSSRRVIGLSNVVSEYDREASLKRPRPTRSSCNIQKKMKYREYGEAKMNKWMELTTKNTVCCFKQQWSVKDTMNKKWPGMSRTYSDMISYQSSVLLTSHNSTVLQDSTLKRHVEIQRSPHYGPCEVETIPRLLQAASNIPSTLGRVFRMADTHVWRRPDSLEMVCNSTSKLTRMIHTIDLHNSMCYTWLKKIGIHLRIYCKSKMQPASNGRSCFFTGNARYLSR